MTILERLRKSAAGMIETLLNFLKGLVSCSYRGHKMQPFRRKHRHWWVSECKVCGKTVVINDIPAPNEIDVSGEAVALNCKD